MFGLNPEVMLVLLNPLSVIDTEKMGKCKCPMETWEVLHSRERKIIEDKKCGSDSLASI
jgi:hypothetical protein